MKDRYSNRLFYAMLCNYTYTGDHSDLPRDVNYLGSTERGSIKFCYFKDCDGCYYLAIRGTDNCPNIFLDGHLLANPFSAGIVLWAMVKDALRQLEAKYGKCSAATGHSLGGLALEHLPEKIQCVAFNAFRNSNKKNISSVRLRGDIAGLHTDKWVSSPLHGDPIAAHKIKNMVIYLSTCSS